jgi:CRP-like cAMP-binding protein
MPTPASAPEIEVFRRVRLFQSLSPEDLEVLRVSFRSRTLAEGEHLYAQGERGDTMAVLVEGRLAIVLKTQEGGSTVQGEMSPGQVVGEMSAIDPAVRSASVVASEPSRVFELSASNLEVLRKQAPRVALALVSAVIEQVTERLRNIDARIASEVARQTKGEALPGGLSGLAARRFLLKGSAPPARPRHHRGRLDFAAFPPTRGLQRADLDMLVTVAPPKCWDPNTDLCVEGEPGHSCFLIAQGQVSILCTVPSGEKVIGGLGPGTVVGQLALVDAGPRTATVRAITEVVALELQRKNFQGLLAAASPLGMRFQEEVALACIRQLRQADARLATLLWSGYYGLPGRSRSPLDADSVDPAYVDPVTDLWIQPLAEGESAIKLLR